MSKVSVVVPVYNVELYLEECVQSVRNQTLSDIEIILVDDGSKDRSGEMCDRFAAEDSRIKVLHKTNEGLSLARRDGILQACSPYICFVDSDDFVELNFCKKLYEVMENNQADLAECAYYSLVDHTASERQHRTGNMVCDQQEFRYNVVGDKLINGTEAVVVWNKIYRNDLLKKYVVDYGKAPLEDYIFNLQYFVAVRKYVYISDPLLYYRQRNTSISRKCNPNTYSILKKVEALKQEKMREMGLTDERYCEESSQWYMRYTLNYLRTCINAGRKKDEVIQFLSDPMLKEKCGLIADADGTASKISKGQAGAVYLRLWWAVRIWNVKCRLAGIKRALKK